MLAQQLASIALARGDEARVRGRVSLLYTPEQAADVDIQTLHAAALEGARPFPPTRRSRLMRPQDSRSCARRTRALKYSPSRCSARLVWS